MQKFHSTMRRVSSLFLARPKPISCAPSSSGVYISNLYPLSSLLTPCNIHPVTINCRQFSLKRYENLETRITQLESFNARLQCLEDATMTAETAEDMIIAFKVMESCSQEEQLGLPALEIGYALDIEGKNPEKTLSFATRALNALESRDANKPCIFVAMALQLMGSANYYLKRFSDSLAYLNRANTVLRTLEEEGLCAVEDIRPVLHNVLLQSARVKTAMGRKEEALCDLKKCLEIKETVSKENSKELGIANRDLAEAYVAVLKFIEALPYAWKALRIHETGLGLNSVEVANDRRVLGIIYTGLKDHKKAFINALEQNQLSQKVFKKWGLNAEFPWTEIDSANIHIALGRYDEALKSLKIAVGQTAQESEARAFIFIMMAKALYNKEEFVDSLRYLEIACGILDKKEKVSPVEVAEAYSEISMLYKSMDDLESAILLLKRTLAMLKKLPQEGHFEERISVRLGWLLLEVGETESAIPHLESAAERLKESFGSKHFGIGYIYHDLGSAYLELDRPECARHMLLAAKDIMDVSFGPHHADSVRAIQKLSYARHHVHNPAKSNRTRRKLIRRLSCAHKRNDQLEACWTWEKLKSNYGADLTHCSNSNGMLWSLELFEP